MTPWTRRDTLFGLASAVTLGCVEPILPRRTSGYVGLAETPYFRVEDRHLHIDVDLPTGCVDFHTHLAFFVDGHVDLDQQTPRVDYLVPCDAPDGDAPCTYDVDVYLNRIVTAEQRVATQHQLLTSFLTGEGGETHTIPNLLDEMDRMGLERAVLLPVALNLVEPDDMTEQWQQAVRKRSDRHRMVQFASVHPGAEDAHDKLRDYADQGYVGIKVHPTVQATPVDDEHTMALLEEAASLDMLVFFHAGRADFGDEPSDNARIEHYVPAIQAFPSLRFVFGHAGATDWEAALALARAHDNVWLELAGPTQTAVETILARFDTERILFGSDWPFYPIAATLYKTLLATEGDDTLRERILATNAQRLLAEYGVG